MSKFIDELNGIFVGSKDRIAEDTLSTMLRVTEKLKNENIRANALKVGDTISFFKLPDANLKEFDIKKALEEKDFVVLNFYRGNWCPYCNLELRAYQQILPELNKLNAKLVAISPQTPDESLSTKEKDELEYEVLSDKDNRVSKEFGLTFKLPKELQTIYKEELGIDLEKSNANSEFELPMPAVYVIDKNGKVLLSYANEDYTKRLDPQKVIDTIKENFLK